MANKQKRKVSNIMLLLICIMIILYTAANFALQYFTETEVSPTLTTAWFAFWAIELINLTFIKTSKVKHGLDSLSQMADNFEDSEDSDFIEEDVADDEGLAEDEDLA